MKHYPLLVVTLLSIFISCSAQISEPVTPLDITASNNFSGFELLDVTGKKVFIIAEDVHNRVHVPGTTLKFMRFLHTNTKIRTLAIEGGASTAYLINLYLDTQDTVLLREIVRHTFFWSKEHHAFIKNLATWNATLPKDQRISVESADIELKQESVILAVNYLLEGKDISRTQELDGFRKIFKDKESHREQYLALNTRYYYDKDQCRSLVQSVSRDMEKNSLLYSELFGSNIVLFKRMMEDLQVLYVFDYKADLKFKYRDDMIYKKLWWLNSICPEGFLYVVGAKHTRPEASSGRLNNDPDSPFRNEVVFIVTTGKKKNGKYEGAKAVTKTSRILPHVFKSPDAVLIRNEKNPDHHYNYTLAFATNRHVNEFPNSYRP